MLHSYLCTSRVRPQYLCHPRPQHRRRRCRLNSSQKLTVVQLDSKSDRTMPGFRLELVEISLASAHRSWRWRVGFHQNLTQFQLPVLRLLAVKIWSNLSHNSDRIWPRSNDANTPRIQMLNYSFNRIDTKEIDNRSTVITAAHTVTHEAVVQHIISLRGRSKHIELRYNYICDMV